MRLFVHLVLTFVFALGGAAACVAQDKAAPSTSSAANVQSPPPQAAPTNKTAELIAVTQIDLDGLKTLLKRDPKNARPLLVNFWATWCDPCREEFPDLVKINEEYRGQGLDFVTISLDDLAEIKTSVPQFLGEMRATMPAYLLKTSDADAAISFVAPDWGGGLPFTALYDSNGNRVYTKMGKIKPYDLRAAIDKAFRIKNATLVTIEDVEEQYEKGKKDAQADVAAGKFVIESYGLTPAASAIVLKMLKDKYNIELHERGCAVSNGDIEYIRGYNEVSVTAIKEKYGAEVLARL